MHRLLAWGAPEYVLERTQFIPKGIDEVFRFFEDPNNLPRITPHWLDFQILAVHPGSGASVDGVINAGTTIDYTLRWFGIRYRWRTLIECWEPGVKFVDTQIRGPYILWHHTHTFTPRAGGVEMTDRVRYRLPFGPFGMLGHAVIVRRQLDEIFDWRREKVSEIFGAAR